MRIMRFCEYCGQSITRASDGAWEDEKDACGCGDGEHSPEPLHYEGAFYYDKDGVIEETK